MIVSPPGRKCLASSAMNRRVLCSQSTSAAFSRRASRLISELGDKRLAVIDGDATDRDDVERAVAGHDAVIVTLGISENPVRVRLLGPARTPLNVRLVRLLGLALDGAPADGLIAALAVELLLGILGLFASRYAWRVERRFP